MGAWGRVDVLVNSAGHGPRDQILKITDEQWHNGLDTYLMNVIRPSRLVAPIMAQQKGGAIINISTAWTFEPSPMFPTSAVFRAGLAAFTKIFADQYAADNVRMNNVLPGWIDSLPATEERRQNGADAAVWHKRGDRCDDHLPCVRRRRIHHRAKPARGRRYHPFGLTSEADASSSVLIKARGPQLGHAFINEASYLVRHKPILRIDHMDRYRLSLEPL